MNRSGNPKHIDNTEVQRPRRGKTPSRIPLTVLLCLLLTATMAVTCTQCGKNVDAPSETAGAVDADAEQDAALTDPLYFMTPDIPDDGKSEGFISDVDPGVYVYQNMTFELCGASDEAAQDYADAISEFKKSAPDVTVYNLVAPTHTEFGLPERLSKDLYTSSQSQNIKAIYTDYTEEIQPINCYNKLCGHKDEYIYFKTDHHWTGLGAYYAYQAFCEQTDQQALSLGDCQENRIDGFEGSFIDCAESLYQNLDTVSYWTLPYETHAECRPEAGDEIYETGIYAEGIGAGSNAYITFIGGDSSLFIAYNDETQNGKKIAVVKESYGNAFVPFLTYNYEEVHVIDFRHFGESLKDYLDENGITEVLFLNNIMSANNPFQVDSMREII